MLLDTSGLLCCFDANDGRHKDAVAFILMHDRHITDSLSTDRHFEQAGFRRLLAG